MRSDHSREARPSRRRRATSRETKPRHRCTTPHSATPGGAEACGRVSLARADVSHPRAAGLPCVMSETHHDGSEPPTGVSDDARPPAGADDKGAVTLPAPGDERYGENRRLKRSIYDREIERLQEQLVLLQYWVQSQGLKVLVIFEGRGSAGKGGVIKRITERTSPRTVRIAALPRPTDRERTQWYFQRYVEHLPAAGEMVLLDRSWYNRAGVERVMGFATPDEVQEFYRSCPEFE